MHTTTAAPRRYILYLQFQWFEHILRKTKTSIEETIIKGKEFPTEIFVAITGKPSVPLPSPPKEDSKPSPQVSWINLSEDGVLDEGGDLTLLFGNVEDEDKYVFDSNKIADDIHGLADKLPTAGFHLDIIWPVVEDTVISIEEHIALFGALQRLKTWHNARLTVVPIEGDIYDASMEPWITYLRGDVRPLSSEGYETLLEWDLVWRGDMRFTDGKGVAAVALPGFSLVKTQPTEPAAMTVEETDETEEEGRSPTHDALPHYDDVKELAAFERTLEVIHIVDLADVPGCLVSSHKFILEVLPSDRLPRSTEFFTWLTSEGRDQGLAVLTRLAGTRAKQNALINNVGGGDAKLKTEQWKKHMYQVPNVEVKGQPYTLHLLLHGDEAGRCIASVMRSPYEMDASIHVQIASSQIEFDDDEDSNAPPTLKGIPVYDAVQLQETEQDICRLQGEALKSFLDMRVSKGQGSTVLVEEMRELLAAVRNEYATGMETKNIKTRTFKQKINADSSVMPNLRNVKTELDQSPSEWLERLVIHHKESIEKKMKRYKSSDMMLGGMMVRKCKDNTIRLDAEEFLKHFEADGQIAVLEEALSPIGVVGGQVLKSHDHGQKHDWNTLKERKSFEELVKYKYAGIRYCLDLNQAQKKDDHFVKMQQKLVWNETASTCTMEQTASPATMEIRSSSSTKPSADDGGRVKGQNKRKLSDSASKKRAGRGMKRKNDNGEHSQANKRSRMLQTSASEQTFLKPSSSPRIQKRTHSVDDNTAKTTVRSSPRRKQITIKAPGSSSDVLSRRQSPLSSSKVPVASSSGVLSQRRSPSSSSKVTTTTLGAAASGRRSSRERSSLSSTSTSGSQQANKGSRKQRHTEILQSIVDKLLKGKGITKDHACYPQCSQRLFSTTKELIKALPPKSYSSLSKEMQSIASSQVEFVVMFELKIFAAKGKKK